MILLAICDAKYFFTMVDIGAYGKDNDAAILNASTFDRTFTKGNFHFSEACSFTRSMFNRVATIQLITISNI